MWNIKLGDCLPHVRRRIPGAYYCPSQVKVNSWRKSLHSCLRPYYRNDWLVGRRVCHTAQWRSAKYKGRWTLRGGGGWGGGGVQRLLPLSPLPVEAREDLLMLTEYRFPNDIDICPWRMDEEDGIIVDSYGKAELILTCNFWNASEGYIVNLRENHRYWMGSGLEEREIMREIAARCIAQSSVLVGGLGLGIIVLELCKRSPRHIQIWEISRDIANLVYPKLSRWCEEHYRGVELELVIGDVRDAKGSYDFVFYDIWDSVGPEHAALVEEMKILGKSLVVEGGEVICWQEDRIMRVKEVKRKEKKRDR